MTILVYDRISYAITRREYTDEGFLRVPGRVARTGIQQYLASELGLKDRNPSEIINVYRPADEVFKPESLSSYDCKDVTDDHPTEMVSADNFKKLTVGVVSGSATQDGDFVQAVLVIKDVGAIKKAEAGKVQLSAGYTAEYVHEPGVTADGEQYEFIQRNIRINHVALVDRARAGAQARIFDKKQEGVMPQVTLDNGRAIEVQDQNVAAMIQDALARATDRAKTAEDSAQALQARVDAQAEEITALKAKTGDAALKAQVAEITRTSALAVKIAGKGFACDALDPLEIKRAAMAKVRPSLDWAGKSAAYVEAAFDMEAEKKESEDEEDPDKESEDEDEEEGKKPSSDSLSRLAADMAAQQRKKAESPQKKFVDSLTNSWKKTAGE